MQEAGAILGRAPLFQRHLLAAYGRDLGAAFQIADDLLDAEGSTEETGKTAGKDAAAGKATMVAVLGTERARAQADLLARQAADHLQGFGERAALLHVPGAHPGQAVPATQTAMPPTTQQVVPAPQAWHGQLVQ